MRKNLRKIASVLSAAVCLSFATTSFASSYANPWYVDLIGQSGWLDGRPASQTATINNASTWSPRVLYTNSNNGTSVRNYDMNWIKASDNMKFISDYDTENKNWYIKICSDKDYATQSKTESGAGVKLDYSQWGTDRLGWNTLKNVGGKTYGKVTFAFDMKLSKNAKWFDTENGTAQRGESNVELKLYSAENANGGWKQVAMMAFGLIPRHDSEENNVNRFPVMANAACNDSNISGGNSTGNYKYTFLDFDAWYTYKVELNAQEKTVKYSVCDASGAEKLSFETAAGKCYWYNAPDNSGYLQYGILPWFTFSEMLPRGVDYYFDNMIIEKETFVTKDASITSDDSKVTASVQIANDVYDATNASGDVSAYPFKTQTTATAAPKLILAQYNETTKKLESVKISEDMTLPAKTIYDQAPDYKNLSVSDTKKEGCTYKAFLWNNLNDATPLCETIVPKQ